MSLRITSSSVFKRYSWLEKISVNYCAVSILLKKRITKNSRLSGFIAQFEEYKEYKNIISYLSLSLSNQLFQLQTTAMVSY